MKKQATKQMPKIQKMVDKMPKSIQIPSPKKQIDINGTKKGNQKPKI